MCCFPLVGGGWLGRYRATVVIEKFDLKFDLFRSDMTWSEVVDLLPACHERPHLRTLVEGTFDKEQVEALQTWFGERRGTTLEVRPAAAPAAHDLGVSALAATGLDNFYCFSEETGCSLDFGVWGWPRP